MSHLVLSTLLQEELVLAIEEEDAEGSMQQETLLH